MKRNWRINWKGIYESTTLAMCGVGLLIGLLYAIVMCSIDWVYGAISFPLFVLGFVALKPMLPFIVSKWNSNEPLIIKK